MELPLEKILISKPEAARLLSISEKKLWCLTFPRGPIFPIQLGGRVLYSVESLRNFIRQEEERFREASLKISSETVSLTMPND